jgi:PTH2 family peptidyl-tRNA hydrolase
MIKSVIVVRKELNMCKGKIAAQVSHACMKVFFDRMNQADLKVSENLGQTFFTTFTPAMLTWLKWEIGEPGFTKIVVSCNNEEELYEIERKANVAKIPNALIIDNGCTEFHGVFTPTCIALGPDDSEKIDMITGDLPLL